MSSKNPELQEYKESRLRSLLKAMSWRIIATLTTSLVAFFVTGEVKTAIAIGSIEFVLKFAIYYGHERLWQLIPRGGIRRFYKRIARKIGWLEK